MGGTTPVLNTVRICWRRHSGVYIARCRCGETSEHPKFTAAEKWATAHRCKETTMRPPGVADTLGVWDAQGPFRLDVNDAVQLVAWVKTLEQRNAAAHGHSIDLPAMQPGDSVRVTMTDDGDFDVVPLVQSAAAKDAWGAEMWVDAPEQENDR